MATKKAIESADYSTEEKIIALYELQKIDSKIDEINKIKGVLPLEVQDLEDEVAGLEARKDNINSQIEELNLLTTQRRDEIEEAGRLTARYAEQQNNVRNNREYDSLSKEIEYQRLVVELAEKRLKEYDAEIKAKNLQVEHTETLCTERMADLENKRRELQGIEQETAREIETLKRQQARAEAKIDERLVSAYKRIRKNVRNGLAVVTVKRDACGGCFNRIPPQKQTDIRQSKRVIVCEYCGRLLVSDLLER